MVKLFCLIAGGAAGTLARYFLSGFVHRFVPGEFPYGTLVVNLSGCFLIGLFSALSNERFLLGPDVRVLLIAGFCAAYTTFSTFMLETDNLIRDAEWLRAFGNVFLSIGVGFLLFRLGIWLGKLI